MKKNLLRVLKIILLHFQWIAKIRFCSKLNSLIARRHIIVNLCMKYLFCEPMPLYDLILMWVSIFNLNLWYIGVKKKIFDFPLKTLLTCNHNMVYFPQYYWRITFFGHEILYAIMLFIMTCGVNPELYTHAVQWRHRTSFFLLRIQRSNILL